MKKGKITLLWILFVLFALLALGSLPHISGFIALLTAALLFPMAKWQDLLRQYVKKTLKTVLVIILALATVLTYPGTEPAESVDTSGDNGAVVTTTTIEETSLSTAATQLSTTTAGKTVITTTKIITTTSTVTAVTTKAAITTKKITTTTKKPTTTKKITTTTKKPATTAATMVWIPTNGGTKYHRKADCSKMIDPAYVTLEEAKASGFTACGRCYK